MGEAATEIDGGSVRNSDASDEGDDCHGGEGPMRRRDDDGDGATGDGSMKPR